MVSLSTYWIAAWLGSSLRKKNVDHEEGRDEFMFLLGGTLTLLGLIIGFTFSMAVSRYDQRKNYEEEEANAIGTEYVRADLLLAVSGMNDVLNSQGYTQAAWWNRIPIAAWVLLGLISIFCNVLVGYGAHGRRLILFMILPITLSISLFLIADIDSPRNGLIHVHPRNLESLAESLGSR